MIFRQLFDRDSSTYTYLLGDLNSGEALLIDPVIANADNYLSLLKQLNLQLKICVDSHTHADHITALGTLRDRTGCISMMGEQAMADCISQSFAHGDQIRLEMCIWKYFIPRVTPMIPTAFTCPIKACYLAVIHY